MSGSESAMMKPLLGFIIVIMFGAVTSQIHDVNLQTPYSGMTRKRSVEDTTLVPPDPHVQDEGIQLLLTRLESLCTENFQYLITDTNLRFQSLENKLSQSSSCPASPVVQNMENLEVKVENLGKQFNTETQKTINKIQEVSSEVNSIVDNMRDELGQNNKNLETKVDNLGKQFNIETQKTINKIQEVSSEVNSTADNMRDELGQNNKNLETKVDNLGKQFNIDTQKTIDKIQEVSSEVNSTVDNMRDELGQNNKNLETKVEDLRKQFNTETQKTIDKIQEVSSEVNSTVDNMRDELGQNNKNLETKVDNLGKQFNIETQKTIDKIQEVSSEVNSTVDNMRDELGQNNKNLETKVDNLGKQFNIETQKTIDKIQEVSSEVNSTVDNMRDELGQNNKNLETKVEDLGKQCNTDSAKTIENIQKLMDATSNLHSDVEAIKRNVSSLINVTRSSVDLSSNSELQQIVNECRQELKDLQTVNSTSCPLDVTLDKQHPRNCREVRECGKTASGTYMIQPERAPKPFEVVCDLETRGGGWTVIQRRFDGSQDFFLEWQDYKNGFGNLGGEFWLGLENIHLLTGFEVNELLVEVGDFESLNASAFYSEFNVGSETEGYSLKVLGAYSGDAGDSLTYQVGKKFSTKDNDQDDFLSHHCAYYHGGAWWYHNCAYSSLNGKYLKDQGSVYSREFAFWNFFGKNYWRLKHTRILVRPKA